MFFQLIKNIGSPYFVYGSLGVIYVFCSRALAFHYTLIISTMMFYLVWLKMIFRYPRPYQMSPDVIPTSCSGQFGCPSATSIRVATIVLSLFLDFVQERKKKMSIVCYILGCLAAFIGIFGVMCSRVYLGAHSINQVIYGTGVGIISALFMHYSVKPQVYKHLYNLSSISPARTNYVPFVLNSTFVFVMTQLIPFLTYWYVVNYTTIPQLYMDNLLSKCPAQTITKVFHERAFPYIGKTTLAFGAYIGILIQHRFFTTNCTNKTEFWKSLIRFAFTYLICWVFLWQLQFVDWSQDIISLYFNKTVIPCGGAAFLLCSVTDCAFEQMGLLNRDFSKKYCVYVHQEGINEELMPHKKGDIQNHV